MAWAAVAVVLGWWWADVPVQRLGTVTYRYPDVHKRLGSGVAEEIAWLEDHACRVEGLDDDERDGVASALSLVDRALADPRVRRLLVDKEDWVVEGEGGGWIRDPAAGRRALAELTTSRSAVEVDVFTYDRGPDAACDIPYAHEETNAYTVSNRDVLLFRAPYLEARIHAPDTPSGIHQLARTLLHETLHRVGFGHPDPSSWLGSVRYNNTVPTYVGCVGMNYPHVDWIEANCHRPTAVRDRSPFQWKCDPRRAAAGLEPGQAVRVRVGPDWRPAEIRSLEEGRTRVRVRFEDGGMERVVPCRIVPAGEGDRAPIV
ncbi:MAG: hypothetical protein ACQEXJ_22990 [Myxococcota bacterium]